MGPNSIFFVGEPTMLLSPSNNAGISGGGGGGEEVSPKRGEGGFICV